MLTQKGNIFDELRKIRKVKKHVPHTMDGKTNVSETFANVYQNLYNSAGDKEEISKLLVQVNEHIGDLSISDVNMVSSEIVRKAANQVKPNKNDSVFDSDCLKRAPPMLFQHLTNIFKMFLIHGHASKVQLIAVIVPLLKDKMGDTGCSDNYRSIALSRILLIIFDWIVILFGKSLDMDDLQFSYQKDCSTWLVVESVSYFLRNGNEVFSCFMDMKKAFDMVKHSLLFQKLIHKNLSPIFVRLLMKMYVTSC